MVENQVFRQPGLVAVNIFTNSCHCGIALSQIVIPENCTVLGVLREGQVISFHYDPIVQFDDYVSALALHPSLLPSLKVALKKNHRVYYSLNDCAVYLSDRNKEKVEKQSSFSKHLRYLSLQENSYRDQNSDCPSTVSN